MSIPNSTNAPMHRVVHCGDAIKWLEAAPVADDCSFVASLPDISEFPRHSLDEWKKWFIETAGLILRRTPTDGVALFYQSDIKLNGTWIDKGFLCQKAAEKTGHKLIWHKIACRLPAGSTTFGRPGYSHLLCFAQSMGLDPNVSSPDVIPDLGAKTWERGMGIQACAMICRFIATQTSSKTIINPFCGHGSILAMANAFGLNAVGIERSEKRAAIARQTIAVRDNEKSNGWTWK